MNKIQVQKTKKAVDYNKKTPQDTDYSTLIAQDTELSDEQGNLLAIYGKLPLTATADMRQACLTTKYAKGSRTDGLISESVIFGFMCRNATRMQNNICRATGLLKDQRHSFLTFSNGAALASKLLQEANPEQFKTQVDYIREHIKDCWILEGGAFTSGIVNQNNPLMYHYDAGNVKNAWSVMVVFKGKSEGGRLILPEYDLAFEMEDNTYLAFSGANTLHGVSPIRKKSSGYRYSIVWYPLDQMRHCLSMNEEIQRLRKLRVEIENTPRSKERIDMRSDYK
jgi:hypothetical protein